MIELRQLITDKIVKIIEDGSYICTFVGNDIRAMTSNFDTHLRVQMKFSDYFVSIEVFKLSNTTQFSPDQKYLIKYDDGESYRNCFDSIRAALIGNCLAKRAA